MLLFWQAPPTEHQNGIIQEYHVVISGNGTSSNYTTKGPFLLLESLEPNKDYNCSIAAYTVMIGTFSEPVTISLKKIHIVTSKTVATTGNENQMGLLLWKGGRESG